LHLLHMTPVLLSPLATFVFGYNKGCLHQYSKYYLVY
jgi:hypothetical protein